MKRWSRFLNSLKRSLAIAISLTAQLSWAVVYSNTSEAPRSVIALGGERGGLCSGTIVGLNPPTVITAKHCATKNYTYFMSAQAEKIILNDYKEDEFSIERSFLPGDIAVLIYSDHSRHLFLERLGQEDVMKVSLKNLTHGESITVCGYGASDPRRGYPNGMNNLRCGTNRLNTQLVKAKGKYKKLVEMINANLIEYGPETRMLIGSHQPDGALLQQADSGGPGYVTEMNGEKFLVGVNSYTIFEKGVVTASALWNLNHFSSQAMLKRAIESGADVRGIK